MEGLKIVSKMAELAAQKEQEEIWIKESSLKELYELDKEISNLNKALKGQKEYRECLLAGILSRNTFNEAGYSLIRKTSSKRIPDIQKFKEMFKESFDSLIKIELGKADQILGKELVTSACDIEQVFTYAVLFEEG
jgi:hypothetical protein